MFNRHRITLIKGHIRFLTYLTNSGEGVGVPRRLYPQHIEILPEQRKELHLENKQNIDKYIKSSAVRASATDLSQWQ
jgi:hypothetical protein